MSNEQIVGTPFDRVVERVISTISEQCGKPATLIATHSRFLEDLGNDSLDDIEMVMSIEDEFNIELTDAEAEYCTTVGKVISLVCTKLGVSQ